MSENEQNSQDAVAGPAAEAPSAAEAGVESGGISESAIEKLAEKLAGRAPSDAPTDAAKPDASAKPAREARPPREGRGERRQGQGGGPSGGRDRRPEGKREGGAAGGNREGKPREGQRDGNRDGRREDRGGRGPFRPELAEIEYDKLVADSLYLDNQAHAVVARLRDLDSGTKSQLRRFYNAVRRACRTAENERQHEFVMLRARLAYTIARHSLRSLDPLERLLLQVTRKNDALGYERFRDLFEAIIAYNE